MAPRKSTTPKTASPAPKRAAAPRKTAKIIRNRTTTTVHLRLFSASPKDPYRIALNPRGQNGDFTTIPVALIEDPTLVAALHFGSVEAITQAEANELYQTYGPVGYLGRTDAPKIERSDDNTVLTQEDWDGKGKMPARTPQGKQASKRTHSTGMHTIDVPGSDQGLHAKLLAEAKAGTTAMPPEASFDRQNVTIERKSGQNNL